MALTRPSHRVYLYVTGFFPSPVCWRGSYSYDFVRALGRKGFHVEVFVPGVRDYVIGDVRVHGFPVRRLPSSVFPFLFSRWNQRSFLGAIERAGIGLDDVEVCHGNTADCVIYPLAVKSLNPSCRTFLHHHDLCSFGLNNGILKHCWFYNLIEFPVLRRLHEQIDTHIFISEASRRSFLSAPDSSWTVNCDYRRQMRGLPYRPVHVKSSVILHNGVDMDLFRARPPSARLPTLTVGCVANYQPLKGHLTLLKTLIILRERGLLVRLLSVGSGAMLATCRRFVAKYDLDVEFRTEVRHERMPDFYREIDLFVLPSYFEGFGCVYTEAHACGVPFIACEGQGIDDVIPPREKERCLCRPEDSQDLADKIMNFAENRWTQHLMEDQDINKLVEDFVRKMDLVRRGNL